jgi:hypothetical protein
MDWGAGMGKAKSDDAEDVLRDDLEEVLRQNLNLRRELATEIGKVRVPKPGMQRLGWTLYWVFLTLAAIWVLMSLQLVQSYDWSEMGPIRIAIWFSPVLVLYAIGRALRDAPSYE